MNFVIRHEMPSESMKNYMNNLIKIENMVDIPKDMCLIMSEDVTDEKIYMLDNFLYEADIGNLYLNKIIYKIRNIPYSIDNLYVKYFFEHFKPEQKTIKRCKFCIFVEEYSDSDTPVMSSDETGNIDYCICVLESNESYNKKLLLYTNKINSFVWKSRYIKDTEPIIKKIFEDKLNVNFFLQEKFRSLLTTRIHI